MNMNMSQDIRDFDISQKPTRHVYLLVRLDLKQEMPRQEADQEDWRSRLDIEVKDKQGLVSGTELVDWNTCCGF